MQQFALFRKLVGYNLLFVFCRSGSYAPSNQPGYNASKPRSRGGVGGGWGNDTAPANMPSRAAPYGGSSTSTMRRMPSGRGGGTGGANNDGTYEHTLIEALCAPGGMRGRSALCHNLVAAGLKICLSAQPPRDKLTEFMKQVRFR